MNIIINHNKLLSGIKFVERIVSKNTSLPILNSILIKTEGGRIKLSATNLEVGINFWGGAKIEESGEIAVPAKIFHDFLNNISDEKINLSVKKNVISINTNNHKTQILGMETNDFPIIPKIKSNSAIKINSKIFKDGLMGVLDSVSLSEIRPELSGVFVCIKENNIEFAATDSFRLSEKIINSKNPIIKSFILPRNTAVELIRLMESQEGEISLLVNDNQIMFSGEDFEIVSRLIDGHYPEYKRVIPEKFISLTKVNRSDLEKNVRVSGLFASTISDIKIKTTKDNMEIIAKNNDRGEIVTNLPCETKNQGFEVSVNYNYILDGLKILPGENIIFQFSGDGSPLVMLAENNKDTTYVIMPLRQT